MHLFYCPELVTSNDQHLLPPDESYHATNVLRLRAGDAIGVTDGAGHLYNASLVEVHAKKCSFRIVEEVQQKIRNRELHIAIAPTKNIDRFEWFLEKSTEIGIETVTPLLCRYSERKEVKPERLSKVIVSAAKQSMHCRFPVLNPMISFKEFIAIAPDNVIKLIAHCEESNKTPIQQMLNHSENVIVLIGPEGDFSPEEIQLAIDKGFKPVSLGESRLRTETAALYATMAFNLSSDKDSF
jgi:16S rRNA (uracil1498-N3)-methyltransferase